MMKRKSEFSQMVNTINPNPPINGFSIDGFVNSNPSTANDATVSDEEFFRTIYMRTSSGNFGQIAPINSAGHVYVHSALYSENQKAHMIDAGGNFYSVQNTMQVVMTMTFQKPDGTSFVLTNVTTQGIRLQPVDANAIAIPGAPPIVMYFPLASYNTNVAFLNYTLISVNTTSVGQYSNNSSISAMSTTQLHLLPAHCFVRNTLILTKKGQIPIQKLKMGDLVWTLDNGFQSIRWIGSRRFSGLGKNAPIHISKNVIGNHSPIALSPNHQILFQGEIANRLFGENEILMSAKNLIFQNGVVKMPVPEMTYYHILFDRHEIILANFMLVESLFLTKTSIYAIHNCYETDLIDSIFDLKFAKEMKNQCRASLSGYEARVLLAQSA